MINEFKNKKITMMGLGVLGRGVNIAKFLAKHGAILTITDLKSTEQLATSIEQLEEFDDIKYVLEKHDLADFRNKDMVIKAAGVPLNSPFIEEARKNNIPVEMDASLFARLSDATIVGVTGTKGKSTVTHLIYEILKNALHLEAELPGGRKKVFLGGNVKGLATLPLLEEAEKGDIVVMELDSWQLQGFGDAQISPHISVFTNLMRDHMNYYKEDMRQYFEDKANIFKYQNKNDFLIVGENFVENTKQFGSFENLAEFEKSVKSKVIVAKPDKKWETKLPEEHNARNIAAAALACKCLGIKESIIKKVIVEFDGVPGRLEFINEINDVKYYNDTTATTPDGAIAGIKAFATYLDVQRLSRLNKIILIGGGADKELIYDNYAEVVEKYVKTLILFKGAASDKIVKALNSQSIRASTKKKSDVKPVIVANMTSMKNALVAAHKFAEKGDIILLSPGAASFGIFKNEFDRGEQFCKIVKNL